MFRDDQRAKLDAILARYLPTTEQKLARADSLVHDLIAQWDLGICRADDANFVETDHPRGADGKFTKGAGTSGAVSHGITAYEKTLKKGAKGSVAGLMKSMLATGDYSEADIFKAAQTIYDLPADKKGYVKWYAKDMAKMGSAPPPTPATSKVGGSAAPTPAAASGPVPTAAAAPSSPPPAVGSIPTPENDTQKGLKAKAESGDLAHVTQFYKNPMHMTADILYAKALLAAYGKGPAAPAISAAKSAAPQVTDYEGAKKKLNLEAEASIKDYLNPVFEHWDKLTPENKPKVEAKLLEIANAIGNQEKVKALTPISDGHGQSVNAVNSAIGLLKPAASAPAYTPTTPAQVKAFAKLKSVPHFRTDHVNYFEDHEGKELKAVLKTDTKKIPGDHYALVTSAYAGKKGDGNTSAVSTAMDSFKNATWHSYSPSEQLASQNYKGSTYDPMNDYLLGKTTDANTPDYIKKYVTDFRTAVNKSVVPADTPAFRGLRCSLKSLSGFDDPEQSVGRCFEHANFASVSRDRGVSESFAGKGSSGAKVLMKLTIPAGATGMVLGNQHGEAEVVLPDKCTFRIDEVEPWDNGKGHFIHVTYLGVRDG